MRDWPTGTTELAPGVFAYVQATGGFCIANAGILRGDASATVVDALFTPSMTRVLLGETARVTSQPIERLINTHHHVDHTLGNVLFPADAEVLAHAKARDEIRRIGMAVVPIVARMAPHFEDELKEVTSTRVPDATFDGNALGLKIGGRSVRLIHYGAGHTVGDVLVHLPSERIVFAGDVAFFDVTPLAFEGHIGNWVSIGRKIVDELDVDTIVPGHGPVGTKDDLSRMLAYFELLRDGARRAFDAGASTEEAVRAIDLGEYGEWHEADRIVPNVARLYQEFRGELDGLL